MVMADLTLTGVKAIRMLSQAHMLDAAGGKGMSTKIGRDPTQPLGKPDYGLKIGSVTGSRMGCRLA